MKINKKRIFKKFIKFDFSTIFFFALSIITATFAWYAISHVVDIEGINASIITWDVVVTDDGVETQDIEIVFDDIYPGCVMKNNTVLISNRGDINAEVNYSITYLRILDDVIDTSNQTEIFDSLAQEYPFSVNFSLQNRFINYGTSTNFMYSVSWPLDFGHDIIDGQWGSDVYDFKESEELLHQINSSYEIRYPVEIRIELKAFANEDDSNKHELGELKLFNNGVECFVESGSCVNYSLVKIDGNNLYYMPIPSSVSSSIRASSISSQIGTTLNLSNVFDLIKRDILDTNIVIEDLSKRIFGNSSIDTYSDLKNLLIDNNGIVEFKSSTFNYLSSNNCYWINESFDATHTFAIKNIDSNTIKLYPELNTNYCKYIKLLEYQ